MRKTFAEELLKAARENNKIWLITADMGFGVFDEFRKELPGQFINVGAAEFSGMAVCCGLAMEGIIPIFYSITPFAIYRPFEVIRNYVNHEELNVKIVTSGRNREYEKDGFSHCAIGELDLFRNEFYNIDVFYPKKKEEIPAMVQKMVKNKKPSYLNLSRY